MKVLVDSSVWVEYFRPKTPISLNALDTLIQEREVATCLPIRSEVLSGRIVAETRVILEQAFDAMDFVDLDWNSRESWEKVIAISLRAQKKKVSQAGIVDRMILACCLESRILLWTLDQKLQKLAKVLGQKLFS